jgi:hypothetical protein
MAENTSANFYLLYVTATTNLLYSWWGSMTVFTHYYALEILLTKKVFQSHFKSSQGDEISSSTTNSEPCHSATNYFISLVTLTLTQELTSRGYLQPKTLSQLRTNQELTINELQSLLYTLDHTLGRPQRFQCCVTAETRDVTVKHGGHVTPPHSCCCVIQACTLSPSNEVVFSSTLSSNGRGATLTAQKTLLSFTVA